MQSRMAHSLSGWEVDLMGYVEAFPIGTWDYCDGCGRGIPKHALIKERVDGITIRMLCSGCHK